MVGHIHFCTQGVPLRLRGVLGVVLVKGGNHKLAVRLAPPHAPVDSGSAEGRDRISEDVRAFMRDYSRTHPHQASRIKYLELDHPEADEAILRRPDPTASNDPRRRKRKSTADPDAT